MSTNAITTVPQQGDVQKFMPAFTVEQALSRYTMMGEFQSKVLREQIDFGKVPGTDKPVLLKAGAEKLCTIFGLSPEFVYEISTEDWTGKEHGEPFIYYRLRCILRKNGEPIGEGLGSASSWEKKYRYQWVPESQVPANLDKEKLPTRDGRRTMFEFEFAIDKAETTGQYGKPAEHWQAFRDAIASGTAKKVMKETKRGQSPGWEITTGEKQYRIPNPDVADLANTILKMATKRALVAAVLIVTNASDAFTQDAEDWVDDMRAAMPTAPAATAPPAETHEELAARRIRETAEKTGQAIPPQHAAAAAEQQADPPALAKIIASMTNAANCRNALVYMKDRINTLAGGDGAYYQILKQHGFESGQQALEAKSGGGLQKCRALVREMYHWIVANEPVETTAEPVEEEPAA